MGESRCFFYIFRFFIYVFVINILFRVLNLFWNLRNYGNYDYFIINVIIFLLLFLFWFWVFSILVIKDWFNFLTMFRVYFGYFVNFLVIWIFVVLNFFILKFVCFYVLYLIRSKRFTKIFLGKWGRLLVY